MNIIIDPSPNPAFYYPILRIYPLSVMEYFHFECKAVKSKERKNGLIIFPHFILASDQLTAAKL